MTNNLKRAVVLGGGGHFGIAWELGYLRGLEEAGLPIREADIFVGTSAGSQASVIVSSDKDWDLIWKEQIEKEISEITPISDEKMGELFKTFENIAKNSHSAKEWIAAEAEISKKTQPFISKEERLAMLKERYGSGQARWNSKLRIVATSIEDIERQVFDENFLMCIATIGAFCISDYKEAIAVMLFYSVGEIFQAYAVNKTRTSISSLMDLKSDYANLLVGEEIKKVAPEEIKIGDEIIVKVGEKVPLDGVVLEGASTLDTSSLTGETLPRNVNKGDEVLAGVVNLTGIINLKVSQVYEDSTVSRILDLVENAASKKAPIEQFITRFARIYTPTVVFLAVALAIVPMLIFKDAVFTDWLYRALTFLVVSCPCALVISIPLGLYAGLGKASKVGALIKGGNYLELLKDIDTVVFDKTGTLTEGSFEVVEINGADDLLMLGAYGESMSNHPIAKSILRKYGQEIAGKGIEVKIDDKVYNLGNKSYIEGLGITVNNPSTVGTVVHIVCQGKYLGNIVVADKIKETTIEGIKHLKKYGIKNTVMLTGDRSEVAEDIAKKIGIDTVYSELLPQDKVIQVETLINQGAKLSFVGDGINDAPVLARADLGIAMGGVGSDAAIEAADIVLMNDDIVTIGEAISISQKTNKILKQNVTFTLIIKIGVLLLTMFGYANMWMGVFADVGVTLIAILNSMRILR